MTNARKPSPDGCSTARIEPLIGDDKCKEAIARRLLDGWQLNRFHPVDVSMFAAL